MAGLDMLFFIAALICFGLAAFGVKVPANVNLGWLGALFLTLMLGPL